MMMLNRLDYFLLCWLCGMHTAVDVYPLFCPLFPVLTLPLLPHLHHIITDLFVC